MKSEQSVEDEDCLYLRAVEILGRKEAQYSQSVLHPIFLKKKWRNVNRLHFSQPQNIFIFYCEYF